MSEAAEPVTRETPHHSTLGARRLVLVTLAITALYLLLQNAWLALLPVTSAPFDARIEAGWPREAAEVARSARAADAVLPGEWRKGVWRLGFQIGYASQFLGSFASSVPENRAKARELMAPRLQDAQKLAEAMGLGSVTILPTATASDFARENERIEADELGIASRIDTRLSARHRHLFLLGMHVGVASALAEGSRGELHNPNRLLIGRHATLAGVPVSAWEAAARQPEGPTPADKLKAYIAAVAALDAEIGKLPALP